MKMYSKLQPIREYTGPQWLIEPVGDPITEQNDVDAELVSPPWIVDDTLRGWGYQHLVRVEDDHGESRYYLAGWDE